MAVCDGDDLHRINSTYTHHGGDQYLAAVAQRLRRAAAPADVLARLGGDEFVLITSRHAQTLADALTAATAAPVDVHGDTVPLRLSTGICHHPGGDARAALHCADRAMYAAKRGGGGIVHCSAAHRRADAPRR